MGIYKQMKMLVFVVTVMYIVFLWMCDMTTCIYWSAGLHSPVELSLTSCVVVVAVV